MHLANNSLGDCQVDVITAQGKGAIAMRLPRCSRPRSVVLPSARSGFDRYGVSPRPARLRAGSRALGSNRFQGWDDPHQPPQGWRDIVAPATWPGAARLMANADSPYVFVTERGGPMTAAGVHKLIARLGVAAKLPFPIHPHMLRHSNGNKLANDGHDTRSLAHFLGHANLQNRAKYTARSSGRFKDFFRH